MQSNTMVSKDENMELLKQPLQVKNLAIHNHLVMAPMECRKTDEYGEVSSEMQDYYDKRTVGGGNLISQETEGTFGECSC